MVTGDPGRIHKRFHLLARDEEPVCFSRGARYGFATADLGVVNCERCLAVVDHHRRKAAEFWAYHLRIQGEGREMTCVSCGATYEEAAHVGHREGCASGRSAS